MNSKDLEKGIVQLIKKAETELPKDVIMSLEKAYKVEIGVAKTQIEAILKNIDPSPIDNIKLSIFIFYFFC